MGVAEAVVVLAIVAALAWFAVPELVFHRAKWGGSVIGRLDASDARGLVALTFDDGPDPRYTPRILQILKDQRTRATFFVVGARAALHPALVGAILADGHELGNHTLNHRHAWTLGPWATAYQFRRADELLRSAFGTQPEFLRPPWGFFNLGTYLWARRRRRKVVLWSIAPLDWKPETGAARVAELVLAEVKSGDVIDLHDSGPRGTPEQVVAALGPILAGLKKKGLRPVTLSELLAGAGRGSRLGTVKIGKNKR